MKKGNLNFTKKYILSFLILTAITANCFATIGDNFSYKGITYTITSENELTCKTKEGTSSSAGNSAAGELIIPSQVTNSSTNKTYKVTEIGAYSFYRNNNITKLTFEEGLETIGQWAFYECTSLTGTLTIPSSVTVIQQYAFGYCSKLNELKFSQGETSKLQTIGTASFVNCSNLKGTLFLNFKNVDYNLIGESAFQGCGFDTLILFNCAQISTQAFMSVGLKSIILNTTTPPRLIDSTSNYHHFNGSYDTATVYYPSGGTYSRTDGWKKFKNFQVIDFVPDQLSIDPEEIVLDLEDNITYQLILNITPDYLSSLVTWSVDTEGKDIVSVDDSGKVTALSLGKATVTASCGGTTATCSVTVADPVEVLPEVQSVEITSLSMEETEDKHHLKHTEKIFFSAEVSPAEAEFEKIEWFDEYGHLDFEYTGNGDGTTVTATVKDGVPTGTINVTARVKDSSVSETYSVHIAELYPGDADDDLTVDVADIITIAHWIVENKSDSFCFINADTYPDEEINVADITSTVDIALNEGNATRTYMRTPVRKPNVSLSSLSAIFNEEENGRNGIEVRMKGMERFKALQADITLPDNISIVDVKNGSLTSSHNLLYNITEDGKLRIVAFSIANSLFNAGEGTLFTILTDGMITDPLDFDMTNIIAVGEDSEKYLLSFDRDKNIDEAGVKGMEMTDENISSGNGYIEINAPYPVEADIFTIDGRFNRHIKTAFASERINLAKGIYLVNINGKIFKTMVK